MEKVCEGNLDNLVKNVTFDDDSEDLKIAETTEDIERSEQSFQESEEEIKNQELDGDLWDIIGETL